MKIFNTYFLLFVIGVATLTPSCAFHSHEYKVPMKKNLHENWEFAAQDELQWRSAEVPGVVHTDLIRHGVIPDPWFRLNEKDVNLTIGELKLG